MAATPEAGESSTQAWVTLATNDSYCLGAVVLANSLKRTGTTRKIVIMITPKTISKSMLELLDLTFDEVVNVEKYDSEDAAHLALLERPELGITFTKLHCWKLVQYTKCVFLDADTMVVQNSDELFDREEFSAAPDAGWPDCFNSGVFVFVPSHETFAAIMEHAAEEGSFDGGDQGLLNTFYSEWATKDIHKHLPFLYNMVATATYTYLPAFKKFGDRVKIVHFIGVSKPWHAAFDAATGQPVPRQAEDRHALKHLQNWWQIYQADVLPQMRTISQKLMTTPTPAFSDIAAQQQQMAAVGRSISVASSLGGVGGGDGAPPAYVDPVLAAFGGAAAAAAFGDFAAVAQERSKVMQAFQSELNRQAWEHGQPDITGTASTENIIKKIDNTLASPSTPEKK